MVTLNATFNMCMASQETNALLWLTACVFNLFINPSVTVRFPLRHALSTSTSAPGNFHSRYIMPCSPTRVSSVLHDFSLTLWE